MDIIDWIPLIAFSLTTLVQLFFYLRYFRLLAFHKPKVSDVTRQQAVSVVICARDEADEIEAKMPGVLAQAYKSSHEIVVVNDNSRDDTKYLLDGLKALPSNEIQIQMNNPTSPAVLVPIGASKMTYLLMPVQIRN